jgi:hypothetical protein
MANACLFADVRTLGNDEDRIPLKETTFEGMKAYEAEHINSAWHAWHVLLVHSGTYYHISEACPAEKWPREGLMAIAKLFRVTD